MPPRLFRMRLSNRLIVLLVVIMTGLVGCVVTAGVLFLKRERIVEAITRSGSENFTWAFNQIRVEYYRLMLAAADLDSAVTRQIPEQRANELRLRYEIFASRVKIVSEGTYRDHMQPTAIYQEITPKLLELLERVDQALGTSPGFTTSALAQIRAAEAEIGRGIDRLSAKAVEVDSSRLRDLRDGLMSLHGFEIGNMLFELTMLTAFSGIALFGLIRVDRQRHSLALTMEQLREARHDAETEAEAKRQALQRALEEEQRQRQLQQRFITMASHEFRTPISVIDSAAQRIMRSFDRMSRSDVLDRVEGIRHTAQRLADLTETMLESGRLHEGKISFNPVPFNLLRQLIQIVREYRDSSPRHLITEDLQAVPVSFHGDPRLFNQVMVNLLSNAVKYSPKGGEIRIVAGRSGGNIAISVADQGVGIPASEVPNLFETFFRASTSAGISGTGLGLNLVKRLVEMQGGTIHVVSVEGRGSTFTVTFPMREGSAVPPAPGMREQALPRGRRALATV